MKNRKADISKGPLNEKPILEKSLQERKKLFESFVGVIKLQEDPVLMQRRWRDD